MLSDLAILCLCDCDYLKLNLKRLKCVVKQQESNTLNLRYY